MISIFAKPAFLNTASNTPFISKEVSYKGHGHLQRVSSMIRGDQIADYLGAKLNPITGFDDDVCIYVKPHIKKGTTVFDFEGKRSYIDIIDGWGLLPVLEKYLEVGVIACSKQDAKILSKFLDNRITFIPQHHCNYERAIRMRREIKTVGIIGTEDAFVHLPEGLEQELEKKGIKLLKYSKFFSREDIIEFYKSIDVQIVWRPYRMRLSNPLKLVNAASFGIPTIAYPETVFEELGQCYLKAETLEEFLYQLDTLRNSQIVYRTFSDECLRKAEEYHIDNVAKEYKKL